MRTLHHLQRPFLGERLLRERPLIERAAAREEVRPPTVEIPDHTRPEWFAVRTNRRLAEPKPNAPQLIRLIRHPYSMSAAAFQRQPLPSLSLARPARETVADLVAAARDQVAREPTPRPADSHPPLERRARPSADAWLASTAGGAA